MAAPVYNETVQWLVFLLGAVVPIYIAFGLVRLTGFRELTRYKAHRTFYYRLNPATKIFALFLVAFSMSSASLYLGLLATSVILASYLTLAEGPRKFALGFLFTVAVVWATVWGSVADHLAYLINTCGFGSGCTFYIHGASVSFGDIITGIVASDFAVSGVFLLALILVMTTTPAGVVRALRRIRFPNPITYSLVVGMKSIPALFDAINSTVKVQFMRGFGSRGTRVLGPLYTIAAVLLALIPALILTLRGARNLAISTGTRAFGAYRTRTSVNRLPFGAADVAVLALAAGFFLAVFLA